MVSVSQIKDKRKWSDLLPKKATRDYGILHNPDAEMIDGYNELSQYFSERRQDKPNRMRQGRAESVWEYLMRPGGVLNHRGAKLEEALRKRSQWKQGFGVKGDQSPPDLKDKTFEQNQLYKKPLNWDY